MKLISLGKVDFFFIYGFHSKRFALGISISRWDFDINVGPFWFTVEWSKQ